MNQAILNKLKSTPELSPDEHDGSYELVRTTVSAYRDVDEAVVDYHDLNAVYLMCIGTWRHSYDKKHEAVHAAHLPEVRKQELNHLIDELKRRAEAGVYEHQEKAVSGTGHMGLFGTGFYSFQNKTDVKSVRTFIQMCVDLLDMTDDEEMYQRAASVLTKSFRGMQAAAASVVLHCLKPCTFPVINSNVGSEDIFEALGIHLDARGKLETYIENCRKIKIFRDANFSFKNYRILDMAAWELSADPIHRVISQYKDSFATWFSEEAYKWRAVQCFQEHWKPERSDFAEMLKKSLAQAGNLMDTNYSFPCKMITFFAEKEPDTVRSMFQQLLAPGADIVEQIQNFKQSADILLAKYQFKESMKQHYQKERTICTYLFFAQPDRYFLYQYGKLKAFLEETGLSTTCKMGDTQNVLVYQEVANQVLTCVQQDKELLNMFEEKRAELGSAYYPDDEHHLLADDIIYFGSQLHKSDYWPSLAEYDPEISAEQWLGLLADRTICTVENLKILKAIQQLGGEATCKQLNLKLGDTSAHYNGSMVQLARRVQEKTCCPLVQNENNDQKWWPILFVGRTALQDQPGTYSWKLRNELADALKRLPQKEVSNPMPFAKNTILYGPPGTGKTYQTANYAVAIIEGKSLEDVQAENHEEVLKRYRQYRQDGRIEFTTFHQSFGYEDFIEGIRPVFAEDQEENSGDISYEIADGVFKKFCATAQPPAVDPHQNPYGFSETPTIWKVSLASTGDNPVRDYCMKHGCIRIGWDEYGESITDDMDYHVGGKTVLNAFLSRMQPGDIVLSCYTAHSIDAIGVVTGEPEWHPEFDHYPRPLYRRKRAVHTGRAPGYGCCPSVPGACPLREGSLCMRKSLPPGYQNAEWSIPCGIIASAAGTCRQWCSKKAAWISPPYSFHSCRAYVAAIDVPRAAPASRWPTPAEIPPSAPPQSRYGSTVSFHRRPGRCSGWSVRWHEGCSQTRHGRTKAGFPATSRPPARCQGSGPAPSPDSPARTGSWPGSAPGQRGSAPGTTGGTGSQIHPARQGGTPQ